MSDVTTHKNMLLRKVCVEENCRLRQKYSICLLEEVVVLGYFADKAQVCRTMFCEYSHEKHCSTFFRKTVYGV